MCRVCFPRHFPAAFLVRILIDHHGYVEGWHVAVLKGGLTFPTRQPVWVALVTQFVLHEVPQKEDRSNESEAMSRYLKILYA